MLQRSEFTRHAHAKRRAGLRSVNQSAYLTSKPSLRRHALCASICAAQASSPNITTHSSRGLRVSAEERGGEDAYARARWRKRRRAARGRRRPQRPQPAARANARPRMSARARRSAKRASLPHLGTRSKSSCRSCRRAGRGARTRRPSTAPQTQLPQSSSARRESKCVFRQINAPPRENARKSRSDGEGKLTTCEMRAMEEEFARRGGRRVMGTGGG